MIPSSVPTKSVKTASMWSRPTSTEITSELGWGYRFERTQERKTLNVCDGSAPEQVSSGLPHYIKRVHLCRSLVLFQRDDGPREQFPRLVLRSQHVGWP